MLGRLLRRVVGRKPESDLDAYLLNGRRPWSRGYELYKQQYIAETLTDADLLDRFRNGQSLPENYGEFLDERVVEYPWLFTRMSPTSCRLLDAGSSLNHAYLLDQPVLAKKNISIVTLAPEAHCHWQRGISYLYADLRELPFCDAYFDEIACISTLEHVGKDNALLYSARSENDGDGFVDAARELRRVCKPGGRILVTVPFGRFTDFGWYQQFDAHLLQRLLDAFMPAELHLTYFRYAHCGWQPSTRDACADAEGFDIHSAHGFDADYAAASRAIAALDARKGGAT